MSLSELLNAFCLNSLETGNFGATHYDLGYPNVFGGQFLAQAVAASYLLEQTTAAKTGVSAQKSSLPISPLPINSLHAQFLLPGSWKESLVYQVKALSQTANFSRKLVTAAQGDRQVFSALTSSKKAESTKYKHSDPIPEVIGPENLLSEYEIREKFKHEIKQGAAKEGAAKQGVPKGLPKPVEIRPVNPTDWFLPDVKPAKRAMWFRFIVSDEQKRVEAWQKRCLLAYASDFGIIGTALLPHGETWYQGKIYTLSLDHSLWFYHDFDIGDWLLYETQSPVALDGRAIIQGNIFSRAGQLVAVVTQEAMIRTRKNSGQKLG